MQELNQELSREIIERKRVEQAVQESEARYRLLFENANAGIILFDIAGVYLMLNEHIAAMLGGKPDDFIGKSLREVFPDEADFHLQRFAKIIREKKGATFEDPFPMPDGLHWYSSCLQPVIDPGGSVIGIQIVSIDITERKQAEQELQKNERLLRQIAANYPNSYLAITEKDYTISFTSGQEFKKQNLDPKQFV
ncbi:MAG: PAS domain S-box protein, partial [bacterium]|nr:PAS domain S-box protein [bacterium]